MHDKLLVKQWLMTELPLWRRSTKNTHPETEVMAIPLLAEARQGSRRVLRSSPKPSCTFQGYDDSDDKPGWLDRALCSSPERSAARGLSVKITYLALLAMPRETERTPAPQRFCKRCVFQKSV